MKEHTMTATKPGPHVCEVTAVRPITSETSGTDGVRNTYTKNLTPLDEWLASDDGKAWLAERGINRDKTLGELVAWLDADPCNTVEWWYILANGWLNYSTAIRQALANHPEWADTPQPGYRTARRAPTLAALIAAVVAVCADGWSRIEHDIHDLTDPDRHRAAWGELTREKDV